MAAPSTPAPRRQPPRQSAPRVSTPAPSGGSGGGVVTALKLLVFAGIVGGALWFGYGEYQKRRLAEAPPAPEPPQAAPKEKIPEVVPDERPVKKDEPVVVKPDAVEEKPEAKVEPLPALPPLQKSEAMAALKAATLERVKDGRWAEHIKVVKAAALAAVNERARTGGAAMLDKLTDRTALPLALAQIELLARVDASAFAAFAKENDFAGVLLTTPELAETFVGSLAAEDRPLDAIRVLGTLDARETKPADKLHFRNLAVALALIHDKPGGEAKAGEVYSYYHEADLNHKLFVDFEKIRPDELVWGVGDHIFNLDDQRWALKNVNFPFAQLGKAYPSIAYRINHPPYPEYTMETILRMGGVCQQQSEYSQGYGRARGVPSASIAGEGSRGGHAWFGFRGPHGWVNNVGRYADGYACGMTRNPQTGKMMREWDLFLFNDPARRNGDLDAARRLAWAANVVAESGDTDGALNLLDAAAQRDKGNPAFWRKRIETLLATDKGRPLEFWEKLVADYRIALRDCPDYFDIADRVEEEKIFPKIDSDRVGETLRKRRRQSIRDNKDRFDLLVASIRREAAYYQSRKDNDRVGLLYNASMREYGKNLPTFVLLADDFAKLAAEIPSIRKAGLSTMESVFNKDVDTKLKGDTFALAMQEKVASKVSKIFEADGDAKKAEKYAERAKVIGEKAKAERAAML